MYVVIFTSIGIVFFLNGKFYQNNSIVSLEEIGEANKALFCFTNKIDCCTNDHGSQGDWHGPKNNTTPITINKDDSISVYTSKGPSYIRLNKVNGSSSESGIYHCKIPDSNGTDQRIYIGIYGNEEGGTKISIS